MAQPDDNNPNEEDFYSAYSLASTHADLVLEHGRRFPNYRYASQFFARGDVSVHPLLVVHNSIDGLPELRMLISPGHCGSTRIHHAQLGNIHEWQQTLHSTN